jgi:hypothetical protein
MAPSPYIKAPVAGLTIYAAYLAVVCPCKRMLSCHYTAYFGTLAAASLIILLDAEDFNIKEFF